MTLVEKRGKPWIDGLRGLAMLFVILGHAKVGTTFYTVTSPIKIPLFFAITGYLFQERKGKQLEFYGKLLLHLVLPWLALALVRYIPGTFTKGPGHLWNGFLSVITGKASGYMPCCIIAQVIHFYIRKFCKNPAAVAMVSSLFFALGLVLGRFGILDIAMFNRAMVAQLFLLSGYLFRKWENNTLFSGWLSMVLCILLYIGLCVVSLRFYPGHNLNVQLNYYYNLPLCLVMIWIGCLALLIGGKCIGKAPKVLQFIGQNTLIFYLWEPYPRAAMNKLLSLLGLPYPAGWVGKLVSLTVTLLGCSAAAILINWLLPELVGKKRSKNGKKKS